MLWTIVAVLLILWLLGSACTWQGDLTHLLLVVALVVSIINFELAAGAQPEDRAKEPGMLMVGTTATQDHVGLTEFHAYLLNG